MVLINKYFIATLFIVIGCIILLVFNQDDISQRILKNKKDIFNYCNIFNVSPRMYVSVIYAELYRNYDYYDSIDELRAHLGSDASVGFAQIKVSTFYWIEKNSKTDLIRRSKNKEEAIDKLITDQINILYSVYYIKLIEDLFLEKYNKKPSIMSLATYYSIGIDYGKGILIDSLYTNNIGEIAFQFYNSSELLDDFPI